MAKAVVSVADACARNLPKVSVKSGEPADGYASVAIAVDGSTYRSPRMSSIASGRLQRRQRRSVLGGVACCSSG